MGSAGLRSCPGPPGVDSGTRAATTTALDPRAAARPGPAPGGPGRQAREGLSDAEQNRYTMYLQKIPNKGVIFTTGDLQVF